MALRLCLALFLALASASAQTPTAFPDTPAGHTLKAFLDAFDSGDRAQLEAYCRTYGDPSAPDAMTSPDYLTGFHNLTGGLDLVQVIRSEPLYLEVVVKNRKSGDRGVATLDVNPGEPAQVADMEMRLIPPGLDVSVLDVALDAATRARVIDGALAKLNEFYVSPELAKQMGD